MVEYISINDKDKRLLINDFNREENEIIKIIGSAATIDKDVKLSYEECFDKIQSRKKTPIRRVLIRPKACDGDTSLMILVKSSIVRGDNRRFIRSTWGRKINVSIDDINFNTQTIFIVGRSTNRSLKSAALSYENKIHNDILQVDIADGYSMSNLVDKSLGLMRFAKKYCHNAKYFLISDDDTMIAPWLMYNFLQWNINSEKQNFYGGFQFSLYVVPRSKEHSRFILAENVYPCASIPEYVQANTMVLSYRTLKLLINESRYYYSEAVIDDIYINWLIRRIGIEPAFFPPYNIDNHCLNIGRQQVKDLLSQHSVPSADNLLTLHDCDDGQQMKEAWSRLCDASIVNNDIVMKIHEAYCFM
uniref:Hexosyltransferase n=1 Tax=Romanomermis culicivorax TaxID=13658 RepID=A0A915JQY9_ROMCU